MEKDGENIHIKGEWFKFEIHLYALYVCVFDHEKSEETAGGF